MPDNVTAAAPKKAAITKQHARATTTPDAKKPQGPKPIKPRTGYIVVRPGWDPAAHPTDDWIRMTLAEARAFKAHSEALKCDRTVIVETTTTFRVIEDGDRG